MTEKTNDLMLEGWLKWQKEEAGRIVQAIAHVYGIRPEVLKEYHKPSHTVRYRHLALYLLYEWTEMSYLEAARFMGMADGVGARYGISRVEQRLERGDEKTLVEVYEIGVYLEATMEDG